MTDDSQTPGMDPVREQVLTFLDGGNAHMSFDDAVANYALGSINTRPVNVAYTPWHLLEHIRRTQRDILDFIRDSDYQELRWPLDYWPTPETDASEADWITTLAEIRSDLAAIRALVADPAADLNARLPYADADRYTLLREALLIADHNAYHIGEFAILRQVMGTWPPGHV